MLTMRHTKNFPYNLRIALIEGDRLQDPPMRAYNTMIDGGVEIDIDGKPVAYHIANRHPLSEISYQPRLEYVRFPAFGTQTGRRNLLHLLPLERIGQHRGAALPPERNTPDAKAEETRVIDVIAGNINAMRGYQ